MTTVKVLVADRSVSVRSVLRRLLEAEAKISVVAEAGDGLEVVARVAECRPDVLVMDLDLPLLGGRELAEAIPTAERVPILVLTPRQRNDTMRVAFATHDLGVIAVLPKPDVPEGWHEIGRGLVEAVVAASAPRATDGPGLLRPDDTPVVSRGIRYVAIGASTGGPGAIFDLLQALGPASRIGVAVVQHIAPGFERVFAEWLAAELGMDVAVARDGEPLAAGSVRVAPPECHMMLDGEGALRLDRRLPGVNGHRPAVDTLFRSLLELPVETVAAVLLSGMGNDGAEGMAALHRVGILTMVQDRGSCALFGMPRAAIERSAASVALPPAEIGRLLARAAGRTM